MTGASELKGQRIDRFDIVAEIASGGMATVYLGRLCGLGGFQRFVAIKRLHPHLQGEEEFVQMFLDEARLAAGIKHMNVVPILEVGASEQGYYLVMEYIEGDTLARLLARAATRGERIPPRIAMRIAVDMLSGLHAAHEHRDEQGHLIGLVHRDVSPQNILVGVDGITRLTDFGVARASARLTATRVGQLKGKIAYMAPEQATSDDDVDRRADVFAAGIVLWETLASRRLFKASTEAATLSAVISERVPELAEQGVEAPQAVLDVCMHALRRSRDERYPTCAAFAERLEEVARRADLLATQREVADYVVEVMGGAISQQRDAVRAWLARSEPSRVDLSGVGRAPSSPSSPPESTSRPSSRQEATEIAPAPEPRASARASRRGLWFGVVAFVAGLVIVAATVVLARGGGDSGVARQPSVEASPALPTPEAAPNRPASVEQPAAPALAPGSVPGEPPAAAGSPAASTVGARAPEPAPSGTRPASGEEPTARSVGARVRPRPVTPARVAPPRPEPPRTDPARRDPPAPRSAPGPDLSNPYR